MGKRKPKPMSDERMLDVLTDSLASLGDLREAGPQAAKELRRLRAEVAAKDAEIAELKALQQKTADYWRGRFEEVQKKERTGKATP